MRAPTRAPIATLLLAAFVVVSASPGSVTAQFGRFGPEFADDGARAGEYGLDITSIFTALDAGEGRRALEAYEKTGREAEARGDAALAVRAYWAAGVTAFRLDRLPQAIAHSTRATSLAPHAPDSYLVTRAIVSSYNTLGVAYGTIGDVAQARRAFADGLTFVQSGPALKYEAGLGQSKAVLLRERAAIELRVGDHRAALTDAQQAVAILQNALQHPASRPTARTNLVMTYTLIARILIGEGRLDDAAAALSRAGQLPRADGLDALGAAVTVLSARVALGRNDARDALRLLREAEAPAERAGNRSLLREIDGASAAAYEMLGQLDAALGAIRSAITRTEAARGELADPGQRATFLEHRQAYYQTAVRIALRSGKPADALALAERSRSRAFLDLLGETVLSKGRTAALIQEETRLRARLGEATAEARADAAQARARAVTAERDYNAFLERVRKENGEQASMMAVEPVTLAEIQALLPDDTTLLEYLVSERDIVVWIVDRQGLEVRQTAVTRNDLVREVRDFRAAIAGQAPLAEIESRAVALYGTILSPAQSAIKTSRLLIVPHDVLHYLPFGALRTGNGKWLVEAYGLATVPSASVLKFLAGKGASANDRVLAVGNPDLGPALALRYAEREARAIGDKFKTAATVLTRADATEHRAKQLSPQAGVLHFAVHGELNEKDPMSSALLLVPGAGDDGRLEVREIFGLDLNAKLVVLSACETGLGALSRGDELVGLQRAFLYAGTPTVVTTLWKVDDRASFMLMRAFYDNLAAKGPAEALRIAQRGLMVDFPHPYAWAAFGLTGSSR
jgi:CHAT domain-containing protein